MIDSFLAISEKLNRANYQPVENQKPLTPQHFSRQTTTTAATTSQSSFYTGNLPTFNAPVQSNPVQNRLTQSPSSSSQDIVDASEVKIEFPDSDTEIIGDDITIIEEVKPYQSETLPVSIDKMSVVCQQCNISLPSSNELLAHLWNQHQIMPNVSNRNYIQISHYNH